MTEKPSAERQAFLQGLRELGDAEGHNVIIEYRSAAWNLDLLPDLAAELVERSVATATIITIGIVLVAPRAASVGWDPASRMARSRSSSR